MLHGAGHEVGDGDHVLLGKWVRDLKENVKYGSKLLPTVEHVFELVCENIILHFHVTCTVVR